jgi:hypothetical protein
MEIVPTIADLRAKALSSAAVARLLATAETMSIIVINI